MPLQVDQIFETAQQCRINGDYDKAIPLLESIIDEDCNHALAHMELGLALCFTGMFDESIRELELAAGLDATNAEIRLQLAKAYTMLGMYDEGKAAFLVVLELSTPGDKHHAEAEKQLAYFENM